jgi:hypothetical protein
MLKRGLVLLFLLLISAPVLAGDRVLSINSGSENVSWFISGEPSLVMNGFNLNEQGITLPAVIDRVSIAVEAAVPNTPIDLVIYQDANGGSPVDATLVTQTQVTINQAGTFTVTLPTPVTITQPAVWIGFYLPVDFRFFADRSGTSVLTYWAWTPGGRFDLTQLSSAAVLGPADGSAPVSINMGGKARITAEIVTSGTAATPAPDAPGTVVTGDTTGTALNPGALQPYLTCNNLLWDSDDERISYSDRVNPHCNDVADFLAPANPMGYVRRGNLYDVFFFKDNGVLVDNRLSFAITHCIRPDGADIDRAVVGSAFGSPRTWRILPTARFGDLICAEVRHGGNLAYFVPG